ncbi:MAG TPA: hypothetical protein VF884_00025 [Nitrososphaeraceae archaeon]
MENNSKPDDSVKLSKDTSISTTRYKPIKRPSAETDSTFVKVLDSIINGLEQSVGRRTYLCGNPDCGTLIIFHSNEPRPVICHKCGLEIDWEGEYLTRIRVCPRCNKEYDAIANYCSYHYPSVQLIEKEIEK